MLTLLRRLLSVGTDAAPEENFFISSGLEFYGDLVARASSGRIEGKFDGHIIECRKLIIGPHATIKGNVFAEEIVVYGYCEGNLYAAGDMKVFDTAVILGDIHASSLIVEHNATFRGNLRKLRTEDFLEITAREKEKIIHQRKSNVYNIHSLNARLEAEQRRARKVANGMPLTPETPERSNTPLKRIQVAASIAVQNDSLTPTAVASGSEMPKAINVQASPVDVSTLIGGNTDFLVPAMDEAFLPDYVVPLPITQHEPADEKSLPASADNALGAEAAQATEPSASLLLLEAQTTEVPVEIEPSAEPFIAAPENAFVETTEEQTLFASEADLTADTLDIIGDAGAEASAQAELLSIAQTGEGLMEDQTFLMDTDDAEAMLEAQLMADESWMEADATADNITDTEIGLDEIEIPVDASTVPETTLEEEISTAIPAEDELAITLPDATEAAADTIPQAETAFSFPTSISSSWDTFPVDQNDNGIRIDPSIPFIRIPDASPRVEDAADCEEQTAQIRATFIDTTGGEISDAQSGDMIEGRMDQAQVEVLRVKANPARTMIPRQLSSPEAFELREASGTMIIIREEEEEVTEDSLSIDRRQQGGPELRGSEPMEAEEPKFKISAVPTAEPGYEPGYTNQQRNTRKPVTVQPENTRRWF